MSSTSEIVTAPKTPREEPRAAAAQGPVKLYNPVFCGVLSYLVPGLGQIVQGRVGKGMLFLICIYALFFYGLFLGHGTATLQAAPSFADRELTNPPKPIEYRISGSVFLPVPPDNAAPTLSNSLWARPQFVAQFWVGVVAWPAIYQYSVYDKNQAYADQPLDGFMRQPGGAPLPSSSGSPRVSTADEDLNAVFTSRDKIMELGWVFSVIAGVLNIMVIYDAVAGPAFPLVPRPLTPKPES